jgi:fatty acid desaturase
MQFKSKTELWKIHGRWYDLSNYMKRHPGGETILKQTQGQGDLSALFESYHAFSDIEKIYESLHKWEIDRGLIILGYNDSDEEDEEEDEEEEEKENDEEEKEDDEEEEDEEENDEEEEEEDDKTLDTKLLAIDKNEFHTDNESTTDSYDLIEEQELEEEEQEQELEEEEVPHGEFDFTSYRELANQVKNIFPNRESVKAPIEWYIIVIYMASTFLFTFYFALLVDNSLYHTTTQDNITSHNFLQTTLTIIASISWMSLGFNVMHDASHYAISTQPSVNIFLSKLYNGLNLWNSKIWFYHHVLNHHSFTGLLYRDPDVSHYYPFGTKKREDNSESIWDFTHRFQEYFIPFLLFIFPGQNVSQAISYQIAGYRRKLLRMKLPDQSQLPEIYDPIDIVGIFITLACVQIAILRGNLLHIVLFLISNNVIYALNIIFDHDSFESIVTNDYQGKDWLRLQIHHSSNFLNDNTLWTRVFGSINHQIEHHLFPNVSNYHYPDIKPIVEDYCLEHDIPYVHHDTLFDAWKSFMATLCYNKKTIKTQ